MSTTAMRLALATFFLAALALAGIAASAASEPTEQVVLPIPCDPVLDRTIEPLIVDEGSEVAVTVKYSFKCTGQNRKINFFLVVENTGALRPGGKLELLKNLKKGLTNFVNQVDYTNGSMGGLTLYADDYNNRVTLQGGETGRQNLLTAIGLISAQPSGGVAGVPGAIRDANQRLPDDIGADTTNVLLIVDAGATIPSSGPTFSDLGTSCQVAHDTSLVILVGLRPADGRLASFGCVSRNWYFYSPTEDGSDLPGLFNQIAERLIKGKLSQSTEYYDDMNSTDFKYVSGSGVPQEPDNPWGSEYQWAFPNPGPGGQVIQYRAKAASANVPPGGLLTMLSSQAQLCLNYKDGTQLCGDAPNPDICIRRKGVESDCANYRATLTPQTPPTPTPTQPPVDTPTPTLPPPSETPVTPVLPTDTPSPTATPGPAIFLPSLLDNARF